MNSDFLTTLGIAIVVFIIAFVVFIFVYLLCHIVLDFGRKVGQAISPRFLRSFPVSLHLVSAIISGAITAVGLLWGGVGTLEVSLKLADVIPVKHEVFHDPIWNLWAERVPESTEGRSGSPTFEPTNIEPDHEYSLVLNLAGLKFSDQQGVTVFSKAASPTFAKWLDRNLYGPTVTLTVIALVDTNYFELMDNRVKNFSVDLAKVRSAQRDGFDVRGSPFEGLSSRKGEAPFSFGLQSFRFKTMARTGKASIAISIWGDGLPIDELTLTLCIGASTGGPDCVGQLSVSNPFAGVDLTMRGKYPDLALHLVDRESGVVGVLRCNSCGWSEDEYREWELMETADTISNQMNRITAMIGELREAAKPDEIQHAMANAGDDIYNVIFHTQSKDDGAIRAFTKFIAKAQAMEKDGKPPPSLFTRIIARRPNLMLAPISLMHINPHDVSPQDAPEFVGFVANVQTPLEYQDYSPSSDCISRWVLFVPPEPQPSRTEQRPSLRAVFDARQPFKDWIAAFKQSQSCVGCIIDNEDDFQRWLSQSGPPESQAVVILSHHSANALFFNEMNGSPRVLSSAVRRPFASPSFVILDACGTSEPGASEFIRQFNFRGVTSAIATSTKVEPVLAGTFLAKFMDLLQQHANDSDYTVSQARFDAVRELRSEYGPRALAFILVGNGAIHLCVMH